MKYSSLKIYISTLVSDGRVGELAAPPFYDHSEVWVSSLSKLRRSGNTRCQLESHIPIEALGVLRGKAELVPDWPVGGRCGSCTLISDPLVGQCIKTREMKGLIYWESCKVEQLKKLLINETISLSDWAMVRLSGLHAQSDWQNQNR
jgi:hypothetical protein